MTTSTGVSHPVRMTAWLATWIIMPHNSLYKAELSGHGSGLKGNKSLFTFVGWNKCKAQSSWNSEDRFSHASFVHSICTEVQGQRWRVYSHHAIATENQWQSSNGLHWVRFCTWLHTTQYRSVIISQLLDHTTLRRAFSSIQSEVVWRKWFQSGGMGLPMPLDFELWCLMSTRLNCSVRAFSICLRQAALLKDQKAKNPSCKELKCQVMASLCQYTWNRGIIYKSWWMNVCLVCRYVDRAGELRKARPPSLRSQKSLLPGIAASAISAQWCPQIPTVSQNECSGQLYSSQLNEPVFEWLISNDPVLSPADSWI